MELKQLKYFVTVAKMGSYTRAAEEIDVAQPVLSRQIRQLETGLRQNLLIRHGRGVVLTDAGRVLLRHAETVLAEIDSAMEDLHLAEGRLTGHITLGLPPTVAGLLALPLVRAFRDKLPEASLTISEGLTVHMEESLHLGRIDIGVFNNPAFSPHTECTLLVEEKLYLIADKTRFPEVAGGVTLSQLAGLPLIMPTLPNTFRVLVQAKLNEAGLKAHPVWEINSVSTIIRLVGAGMGCAVLSKYCLDLLAADNNLIAVPIKDECLKSRLYLAHSSRHPLSRLQKEVLQLIRQVCADYYDSARFDREHAGNGLSAL